MAGSKPSRARFQSRGFVGLRRDVERLGDLFQRQIEHEAQAEDEATAGLDALVTTVHMLAGRTGDTRVGVLLGGLADRDRKAEGVAPGARLRHAAIAWPAMDVAPLTLTVAVEPDPAVGMVGASWADHREVGLRACHGPTLA
jgi:hypothetical protein